MKNRKQFWAINFQLSIFNAILFCFVLICGIVIGVIFSSSFREMPFKIDVTNFMNLKAVAIAPTPENPPLLDDYSHLPDVKDDAEDAALLRRASMTPESVDDAPVTPESVDHAPAAPESVDHALMAPESKENAMVALENMDNASVAPKSVDKSFNAGRCKVKGDVEDDELLRRASRTPKSVNDKFEGVPKVAFMFLTKGPVYMAPFWEMFFKGHEGLYSIYVHSDPSYNESSYEEGPVFQSRRIRSKNVEWGGVTMIEAERRLLANALLDESNQRFVLLSESCIPIFNFSTIYLYLTNTTQNYVETLDVKGKTGRGRYRPKMAPAINIKQWRKGAQWFQINRELAHAIVSDNKYFPIFDKYCVYGCYSDEHYIPTLVNIKFGARNSNRTLTWVDWTKGMAHPSRFIRTQVTHEFMKNLRFGNSCKYNGEPINICHLFARKFLSNCLDRLLKFGPKILHF